MSNKFAFKLYLITLGIIRRNSATNSNVALMLDWSTQTDMYNNHWMDSQVIYRCSWKNAYLFWKCPDLHNHKVDILCFCSEMS